MPVREHATEPPLARAGMYVRVIGLAWPIIAQNLLETMVGVVDTILVARLGATATAGVGTALQVLFFLLSILSAVTIGEMRRGIERLPAGRRKVQLTAWLIALCERMKGRVLGFNASTAHVWGQLKAKWDAAGIAVPSLDSQIAATAHRHGLTVVTRNTADFARTGIKLLNPFL